MSDHERDRSPQGPGRWTAQAADQVTGLVFRYLDGLLGPEELGRFNTLLLKHGQARDLLALLSIERFVLQDVLQARDASENNRSNLLNELAELEAQAATAGPIDITEQVLAEEERARNHAAPPPAGRGVTRVIVIPKALVWIGLAAVILLGVSLVWPWIVEEDRAGQTASVPAEQEQEPAHAASVAAVITKRYSAGPEAETGLEAGRDILIGQQVVVGSGLIELMSPRGVRLVVQGPSTIRFDETMRMMLEEGRLVAQVGERGKGFTVQTPNGRVVDHGTAFGVHYEPGQRVLETSVFEGTVSIHAPTPDTPARTLTGGLGGRVDAAGQVTVVSQPATDASRQAYVRVLPETGYTRQVLRLKPAAFWTFDEVDEDQQALNHFNHWVFSGQHHGPPAMGLTRRPNAVAGFDQALRLEGKSYLDFGDALDLEADQAFTFAFWIRPAAHMPSGSVLSRMAVTQDYRGYDIYADGGRLLFQLKHKFIGDHAPDQNDALRVEAHGIQARQWAHVVFAYDGSRTASGVSVYINGRPTGTRVLSDSLTGTIRTEAPFRVGRRLERRGSKDPGDGLAHGSYFTGSIDELMVFRRALKPEEVRGLYRAATDPSQARAQQDDPPRVSAVVDAGAEATDQ